MQLRLIINNASRLLDKTLRQWATAFNVMGVELEEGEVMLSHLNEEVTDILYRGYYGTSTTNLTIGGGVHVVTTQSGLGYTVGQRVRLSYSDTRYMEGYISAYSGTSLTFTCDYKAGTGAYNSWVLSPTTEQIVPDGGSSGQVLAKASADSYDVEWVNVSSGSLSGSDAVIDCGDRMTGNEVFDCGLRL